MFSKFWQKKTHYLFPMDERIVDLPLKTYPGESLSSSYILFNPKLKKRFFQQILCGNNSEIRNVIALEGAGSHVVSFFFSLMRQEWGRIQFSIDIRYFQATPSARSAHSAFSVLCPKTRDFFTPKFYLLFVIKLGGLNKQ